MNASLTSRRRFLAGLAAVPAAAAPTAAVAAVVAHPDAALIEAGSRWQAAIEARRLAEAALDKASAAAFEMRGLCPEELQLRSRDEDRLAHATGGGRGVIASAGRMSTRWDDLAVGDEVGCGAVWKASGLERAIAVAPAVLGRAGRTPMVIHRLRGLIPIAREREALCLQAGERFDTGRLSREYHAAREAADEAEKPILELSAATLDGVAVKARLAAYRLEEWARDTPHPLKQSPYLTGVVEAALAAAGGSA